MVRSFLRTVWLDLNMFFADSENFVIKCTCACAIV